MTWITINNVQMPVTSKAGDSELRILCFANCIMVIGICIKFQEKISNSFQVKKCSQIYYRNHYFQSSNAITQKVG